MPSVFDTPSGYTAAEKYRKLPRMLLGGTEALQEDPSPWVPAYNAEEQARGADGSPSFYDDRIKQTVVEPWFANAVDNNVATLVGREIVLNPDVPVLISGTEQNRGEGWAQNIDLRGNNLSVFFREALKDADGEGGFTCVLADHPPRPAANATEADVEAAELRPFLRQYRARDVIEAKPEYVNGRQRLGYVKLAETGANGQDQRREIKAAPWDKANGRYVEGGVVTWTLWEQSEVEGKKVDVVAGAGTMAPHQEIPLRVVYLNMTGFFQGRSPHLHLASLNLLHTQLQSALVRDLQLAMGGTMHRAGITAKEAEQRAVGPRSMIWSTSENASAEYVHPSSDAFEPTQRYMEGLERKAQVLSNAPSVGRTGNVTATSDAINTAEAKTQVEAEQIVVRDWINGCLADLVAYRGEKSGGSVTLPKPKKYIVRDDAGFARLQDMVDKGQLTTRTLLEVAVQQGIGGLPDDLKIEDELAALKTEEQERQQRVEKIRREMAGQPAPVPAPAETQANGGSVQ